MPIRHSTLRLLSLRAASSLIDFIPFVSIIYSLFFLKDSLINSSTSSLYLDNNNRHHQHQHQHQHGWNIFHDQSQPQPQPQPQLQSDLDTLVSPPSLSFPSLASIPLPLPMSDSIHSLSFLPFPLTDIPSVLLSCWMLSETVFFVFYLLQKSRLQQQNPQNTHRLSTNERNMIFKKILDGMKCKLELQSFFSGWFFHSSNRKQLTVDEFDLIYEENMAEW